MGREHPTDTLWKAQELYCVNRLSYAAVAEAVGVSATTLKAWGQKYDWARKRAEIAEAESEIRINVVKGRKKALEELLGAENAKEASAMAFAVSSLESLAMKQAELAAAGKIPGTAKAARRKVKGKADAIAALREAVEMKLGLALADPEKITTATVQDVKRCLDLVAELEAGLPKEIENDANRANALSPENARIVQNILGTA